MKKISEATKKDWIKLAVYMVLYILFLIWVRSWLGIIVIPFIFDACITRIIRWDWWKQLKNRTLYSIMGWIDALVFALVAVYFVNLFLFQNYAIPSSSLEKSLLVGDHLYVSKVAYGPRKPMTPLTMPLTQNVFPNGKKSYIEKPHGTFEPGRRPIELSFYASHRIITQQVVTDHNCKSGHTIIFKCCCEHHSTVHIVVTLKCSFNYLRSRLPELFRLLKI